ncbi:DUF3000 domain-containing protein [Arthrobacter sp. UM1]|uniref:DUF3000 domain-containing protein n=1 Tax=Arthrobacter sp. UM1 TaxID=2766776 RepID=UPI001CF70BE4|nr:DUF3000 domain-containing protein [Arthrobacter sp. UM1]MCB4207643.1 DUF3000 domain-containing protein [Arthrobacter sp. UM1]
MPRETASAVPAAFRAAVSELAGVPHRRGLRISEVPAPKSAAPFAVALGAEARAEQHGTSAAGRFMLLHDPSAPEDWDGDFRVVTYVRADLEEDMGNDPLMSSVAWDWLTESLDSAGAAAHRLGGHATRVHKESFGTLDGGSAVMDIELRASWTPRGSIASHLSAWQSVLSAFAGFPPENDDAAPLPGLRYT